MNALPVHPNSAKLPDAFSDVLEAEISALGHKWVRQSIDELATIYRESKDTSQTRTAPRNARALCAAYMASRAPATFAIVTELLTTYAADARFHNAQTMLDLGAGPGTATWSAMACLHNLKSFTQLEPDPHFNRLAYAVAERLHRTKDIKFRPQRLNQLRADERHDLVVACYVLNEVPETAIAEVVGKLWDAAQESLVIIEPGSPLGFRRILQCREALIEYGAHLVAPCPNSHPCPIAGNDWCHFSKRLSQGQRQVVEGFKPRDINDEKYSYLIATRSPPPLPKARIVRRPIQGKGHVHLDLCTEGEIRRQTTTRRDGPLYKQARKAIWGDPWPKIS